MQRNHNAQRSNRGLPAAQHRNGDAPGIRINHAGQLCKALVGGLSQQRPHGFRLHLSRRIRELFQVVMLDGPVLICHQGESCRGNMNGHPAGNLGPVGY